ncbi:DUF5713 family protein [Sabulibacter ruber]|uniref:DUF5713 family protein n=1 Tax=Sabulibacter ruber TaxID=2811901 RepID=UPI001F60DF5C|nr:DUF5713 family protein [Sabulibacter ruber]
MKRHALAVLILFLVACDPDQKNPDKILNTVVVQANIKNEKVKNHAFLKDMYDDSYFPDFLVDKGKVILTELCLRIEDQKPENLEQLYELTHASTDQFNDLEDEFFEHDSELETAARECIAMDFDFIAKAYGFDADVEELIATRNW